MDQHALETIPDEEIAPVLPDRPVVSLRDIEVLYGELYTLGTAGGGKYAKYLTPDAARDLVGEHSLLAVRVDLTGEEPQLGDTPVKRRSYSSRDIPRVAHAKYESARGVDHSLTHQSGQQNGREKQATHATDRLTRWPTEDAVVETASEHEDGWLIETLANLGDDEDVVDRIQRYVTEENLELVPDPTQLLVTVAFRVDPERLGVTDAFRPEAEWHYPGEFEVLQEAMAARKTAKFRAKNQATDAVGDGTCYVRDTEEQVYGVVDDPLKFYLSKQTERFPQFDPDEAWRTQGLSRDAAIAAQNATTFIDACRYSGPGVSVYTLPYFPVVDREHAESLYTFLADQVNANEDGKPPIEAIIGSPQEARSGLESLEFYVFVVEKYQKDRWRLLASQPNARTRTILNLAENHQRALDSPAFETEGSPGVFRTPDNFPLLATGQEMHTVAGLVSSLSYFVRTCLGEDTDDPSSDDFRFQATAHVVGGQPVNVERLLSEYVDRITEQFDPDNEFPFPSALVASQYVQLTALAASGLLEPDTPVTEPPRYMTERSTTAPESRTERLEQFIENHPALRSDPDDGDGTPEAKERYGAFMLGALVGRISRYQRSKNRSMTAVTNHPVDSLTKYNIKRTATEVIDSNIVYSDEEGYTGTMYAELMNGVVDGLLARSPDDWTLSTDDLRFHYALGIAYGLNDRSTSNFEENDNE